MYIFLLVMLCCYAGAYSRPLTMMLGTSMSGLDRKQAPDEEMHERIFPGSLAVLLLAVTQSWVERRRMLRPSRGVHASFSGDDFIPPHPQIQMTGINANAQRAKLQSGSILAEISLEKPSWLELGIVGGLQLGVRSKPFFELISKTGLFGSPRSITSADCFVKKVERNDRQIKLHLFHPAGLEATFEINIPLASTHGYIRTSLQIWCTNTELVKDLALLRLIEMSLPINEQFSLTGRKLKQFTLPGLPAVLGGKLFLAGEHPMAIVDYLRGQGDSENIVSVDIHHAPSLLPPTEERPWRFGTVVGVIPEPSQARRAFLKYLHTERPGRRTPMVHYNSWFDFTGWQDECNVGADKTDTMTESACSRRIQEFGERLAKTHNVQVDSFLFDDGWDDTNTLWQFDKTRFPNGLSKLAAVASEYGSGVSIWLSPWGGYGASKKNRVREGKKQGFETKMHAVVGEAFDLAGERYRKWFVDTISMMRREQGVNMFKFDGTSSAPREMEAMLSMVDDVRNTKCRERSDKGANDDDNEKDEIWINLTTGTWASPFFLLWADSIWRGGRDVAPYPGEEWPDGLSPRQKWIRWRAQQVQQNIVERSFFFPLSQLMIHGVVLAGHGDAFYSGLGEATDVEFAQEIWSFVGLGLQLQELYISPDRMTTIMWALLAEGLAWSRRNSRILLDSHWAFGDVSAREVFCAASWDPDEGRGFVLLQNSIGSLQDSRQFCFEDVLEMPSYQSTKLLNISVVKSIAGSRGSVQTPVIERIENCIQRDDHSCLINARHMTSVSLYHTEVLVLEIRET